MTAIDKTVRFFTVLSSPALFSYNNLIFSMYGSHKGKRITEFDK